jgi:Fibronectin type III domain.
VRRRRHPHLTSSRTGSAADTVPESILDAEPIPDLDAEPIPDATWTPSPSPTGGTVPSKPTVIADFNDPNIDVSWGAPTPGGSQITGYTVQITWDGGSRDKTVSASTTLTSFDSIYPGTTYTVSVAATNSYGTGPGGFAFVTTPDSF